MPLRAWGSGFFADPVTKQAIRQLAKSKDVTIFAGAGVAAEQGYPSWAQLVSKMLAGVLEEHHLPDATPEETNRLGLQVTNQYYQIPTATIIDELYRARSARQARRHRDNKMRALLYENDKDRRPVNLTLVEGILYLAYTLKSCGVSVDIATTNYDDLFEKTAQLNQYTKKSKTI